MAEQLWQNLVPGGKGVVLIKDPQRYDLQPGLETVVENAGVYTLSGAHQSHCIVSSGPLTVSYAGIRLIHFQETDPRSTFDNRIRKHQFVNRTCCCGE